MGGSTTVQAPQPTSEEIAIQREQLRLMRRSTAREEALEPFVLRNLRLTRTPEGGFRRLTDEEFLASLSPTERLAEENLRASLERERKALAGELPLTEAGQQRKAEEFRIFKEAMARAGNSIQGDTPETATATTTAGIQGLRAFNQRFGLLEEAERRGELSTGSLAVLQRLGVTSDLRTRERAGLLQFPQAPARLAQGFAGLLQPFQFQRALEFQARQQTAANRAGLLAGAGELAGTVGAAALLSARKYKKDIRRQTRKEEAKALEMVKDLDTYTYKYKWEYDDTPKRMGLMADEAPSAIVTADREGLDVGRTMGLLVVATKALVKKVERRGLMAGRK